jgi:hypothetical protein
MAAPLAAAAGDATANAIRELSNDDFRVRTQAALALGSTNDAKAVQPLCSALADSKSAVRAAAAAALGKLALGGEECLSQREPVEQSDTVKAAIQKAIVAVRSGSGSQGAECVIDANTRFYISIGKTSDATQRKKSRVPELVRATIAKALSKQRGYCVGPDGETKAAYLKRVGNRKQIRGLMLSPKIQAAEYQDDAVTVRFEIAILTFPEKALKGMIPVKLTQQGSVKKSEQAEDELFRMAVERAVEKLLKNIERID